MHSSDDQEETVINFGDALYKARKQQKFSIEEIAEQLKVPSQIISALEQSELSQLPSATYTRGYLRAYAKYLEIKDTDMLADYDRIVPHNVPLKPRSNLPNEKSSQSPLFKTVTFVLIILGVLALIYGGYQYYNKQSAQLKASSQALAEQHASEVSSVDNPKLTLLPQPLHESQNTPASTKEVESGSKMYSNQSAVDTIGSNSSTGTQHNKTPTIAVNNKIKATTKVVDKLKTRKPATLVSVLKQGVVKTDTIELLAKKGAWVKITDATGKRLHYGMISGKKWQAYSGKAPFNVSMGNARSTKIRINHLNADISSYIRPNNTAQFKLSTTKHNGQQIIRFQ